MSPILTRYTAGAQKEELVKRILESMQKEAAGEEEDEEAMGLWQVNEKLDALSEAELKQMLREMQLPTKGKVSAPSTTARPSATHP